jgi:hypothetical protein
MQSRGIGFVLVWGFVGLLALLVAAVIIELILRGLSNDAGE